MVRCRVLFPTAWVMSAAARGCTFSEPKSAKNRVHLDVQLDGDLDEQVERLRGTGAGFVRFDSQPGHRWVGVQDPEGNEFCTTPPPPGR